jgi:plastocyanin
MAIPRITVIVPLLLAGMFVPALGNRPAKPPTTSLGMTHEGFSVKSVQLDCGQTLTMQNDSRWVHIIGPGRDGLLHANPAVPVGRRQLMETNDVVSTDQWTHPGTYFLTCSVHPEMTVRVTVRNCCCTGSA